MPAGETKDPRRTVPFALIMTIIVVTLIMTLAQVVALGTLPALASSKTPLADSAVLFMGAGGAALITLGAVLSTSGNNMGQALSGSRNLFALAEHGRSAAVLRPRPSDVPHAGHRDRVHRRGVARAGAVGPVRHAGGGQRRQPAGRLRGDVRRDAAAPQAQFAGQVEPPRFTVPFGPVIPALAIVIALAILAGASGAQLRAGGYALAAGAMLYVLALRAPALSRENS